MRRSLGWRWEDEPACGAEHEIAVMVDVPGVGYARPMFSKAVRCARRAGHKDWHSCDDASWDPNAAVSGKWEAA